MPARPIMIDVISDVVCPWCFVGRKRLQQALNLLPDVEATIHWRPYQLDPTIPASGKDRKTYMREKFGSSARVDEIYDQLIKIGEENDIEFDFDAIKISPNTLDAHRVIHWAAQAGIAEAQDALVGELFSRYFEQGQNIGDHKILVEATAKVGLEAPVIEKLLKTDADKQNIAEEIATATRIGVRGVPCFIIDQKYAVMGAQSADILADAIGQAASGFEPGIINDR